MPTCNGQLKALRHKAGLSQNKLARAADLDRATISSAERGSEITELSLAKLVDALAKATGSPVTPESVTKSGG